MLRWVRSSKKNAKYLDNQSSGLCCACCEAPVRAIYPRNAVPKGVSENSAISEIDWYECSKHSSLQKGLR